MMAATAVSPSPEYSCDPVVLLMGLPKVYMCHCAFQNMCSISLKRGTFLEQRVDCSLEIGSSQKCAGPQIQTHSHTSFVEMQIWVWTLWLKPVFHRNPCSSSSCCLLQAAPLQGIMVRPARHIANYWFCLSLHIDEWCSAVHLSPEGRQIPTEKHLGCVRNEGNV